MDNICTYQKVYLIRNIVANVPTPRRSRWNATLHRHLKQHSLQTFTFLQHSPASRRVGCTRWCWTNFAIRVNLRLLVNFCILCFLRISVVLHVFHVGIKFDTSFHINQLKTLQSNWAIYFHLKIVQHEI